MEFYDFKSFLFLFYSIICKQSQYTSTTIGNTKTVLDPSIYWPGTPSLSASLADAQQLHPSSPLCSPNWICFKFPFQPCETTTPISSSHFRFLPQVSAELKVDVKFNTSKAKWVAKLNVKTSSNTFQKPCQKQTDFKQVWWMLKSPIYFSKFHSNPFGTCWEFSHKTSNFDFVVESK